jgi:serine/threonine protein kinase
MQTQVVGVGSQGTVYVAIEPRSNRQVACKVLPLNGFSNVKLAASSAAPIGSSDESNGDGRRNANGGSPVASRDLRSLGSRVRHTTAYREIILLKDLNHVNFLGSSFN